MLNTPSVITMRVGKLGRFSLKLVIQILWIAVSIADDLGTRQATAIDDAGMIQLIGEDGIFLPDQGRNGSQVGAEPRLEGDRGFDTFECANLFSSLRCKSIVPAIVRTAAGPTPYFSTTSRADWTM